MVKKYVGCAASCLLRICFLLFSLTVLLVGVVGAQDYEAMGRRLRAAVEANEITGQQARFMLGALKLAEGLGEHSEGRATRVDDAAAEAEIKAMVGRGEVSENDARTRLDQTHRMLADDTGRREELSRWEGIRRRIEGAVERGDLTREEADAKCTEIMRRMLRAKSGYELDWPAIKRRIEGAVERGDLTREEADAKYADIKRRKLRTKGGDELDWPAIKRRIEGAVARGEITRQKANDTYRVLKK